MAQQFCLRAITDRWKAASGALDRDHAGEWIIGANYVPVRTWTGAGSRVLTR
jgi:hypothetical protein